MRISKRDWDNYVDKLSMIDKKAADLMKALIKRYGMDNNTILINCAYAIATKYGEAAAALTATMYDAIVEAEKLHLPPAQIAETATIGETAKTINGTLKSGNEGLISTAVGVLVKRASADTMLKNALRDGAEFAWIPHGDSCAFCLTLASNGWRKASEKAIKNGDAEHIHANCDCTYAIRFNEKSGVEGYDPEVYKKIYYNADGNKGKDKINSIRRNLYEQNKDKILEQKRAAYAARKERESEG